MMFVSLAAIWQLVNKPKTAIATYQFLWIQSLPCYFKSSRTPMLLILKHHCYRLSPWFRNSQQLPWTNASSFCTNTAHTEHNLLQWPSRSSKFFVPSKASLRSLTSAESFPWPAAATGRGKDGAGCKEGTRKSQDFVFSSVTQELLSLNLPLLTKKWKL